MNIRKCIIPVFLFLCIILCIQGSEQGEGDLKEFFGINAPDFFARKEIPEIKRTIRSWLDDCQELGISRQRIRFDLGAIEPEKGRFEWDFADLLVTEFKRKEQEILPVVYRDSPMLPFQSDSMMGSRGLYCDRISLLMKRYNKDINVWEIFDKPPFSPDPDHYAGYLKSTLLEARLSDPKPRVAVNLPDPYDLSFWESLYKAMGEERFDLLSFPYYPKVLVEEELLRLLVDIQYLKMRFGDAGKRIWISQMGVPLKQDETESLTPDKAAEWMVKAHIMALSSGLVDCIFWNALFDNQLLPESGLAGSPGLFWKDHSPKPAFFAYRTMIRMLKDKIYKGTLSIHPEVRAFLFQKDHKKVVICWAAKGDYPMILTSEKSLNLVNLYGSDKRINPTQNLIKFTLSSQPVYLTELTDQMDVFQSIKCSPEVLYIHPGEERELTLILNNKRGQIPLKRTVQVSAPLGVIPPEHSLDIKETDQGVSRKTFRIAASPQMKPGLYSLNIQAKPEHPVTKTISCLPALRVIDPVRIHLRGKQEAMRFKMETRIENVSLHNLKASLSWELKPRGKVQTLPQKFTLGSNDIFTTNSSLIAGNKEARLIAYIDLDNGYTKQEGIGLMSIPLRLAAPKIDGDLREWNNVPELLLNGIAPSGKSFEIDTGKDVKTKAVFQFWITESDLYISAVIQDDTPLINPLPNDRINQGDGVELFLGLGGPTESNKYGDKDFHIGIAPGQNNPACLLWNWTSGTSITMGEGASIKTQNGYILETRIPFNSLGAWIPKRDLMIGFDVALNDLNEKKSKTPHTLVWNGNADNRCNPSKWGLAIIW